MTAIILLSLLIFGFVYNWFVSWLERKGYHEGYVSIMVVAGTAVTLVGFALLRGVEEALWALGCFAASGFFMVLGSFWRHVKECEKLRGEILDGFASESRGLHLGTGGKPGAKSERKGERDT